SNVIKNPKAATVRSDRQIVVLNNKVSHRCSRHVESQRLPIIAVIKRDVDGALGSGEQQSFSPGIFPDDVDRFALRDSLNDLGPSFPGIVGSVNVWTHVIQPKGVDRGVSGVGIKVTSVNDRNFLPGRNGRWRNIVPVLSPI